jgi:hypothetical protein
MLLLSEMSTSPVLIAGAGIGGLSVALTLHQIGLPCIVFESVACIKPLGLVLPYLAPLSGHRHGVNRRALQAYDTLLCAEMSQLVLRNRGAGPFGLLNLVDDRCGGVFHNIDDVIPKAEREAFMHRYKTAAGFAAEKLNAAPPTIPPGARVQ